MRIWAALTHKRCKLCKSIRSSAKRHSLYGAAPLGSVRVRRTLCPMLAPRSYIRAGTISSYPFESALPRTLPSFTTLQCRAPVTNPMPPGHIRRPIPTRVPSPASRIASARHRPSADPTHSSLMASSRSSWSASTRRAIIACPSAPLRSRSARASRQRESWCGSRIGGIVLAALHTGLIAAQRSLPSCDTCGSKGALPFPGS